MSDFASICYVFGIDYLQVYAKKLCTNCRNDRKDVKRSQNLEAKAKAEAKASRSRSEVNTKVPNDE